jgi:hypothetical protein
MPYYMGDRNRIKVNKVYPAAYQSTLHRLSNLPAANRPDRRHKRHGLAWCDRAGLITSRALRHMLQNRWRSLTAGTDSLPQPKSPKSGN